MGHDGKLVFPTKTETAYPPLLCQRVAALVKEAAIAKGAKASPPAFVPTGAQEEVRAARRHGWANLPPLVAEYKEITDNQPVDVDFKPLASLPTWGKMGTGQIMGNRRTSILVSEQYSMGDPLCGVYRTPAEFLQASLQARHPIDFACSIPEILVADVVKVLNDGPKLVNARRRLEVMKVRRLAQELAAEGPIRAWIRSLRKSSKGKICWYGRS